MRIIFLLLIGFPLFHPFCLPQIVAPFSLSLQKKCAKAVPQEMKYRALAQSFLCGAPLSDPDSKEIFRQTGLLHLMVVSGGHLQILAVLILCPWPVAWRKRKSLQFILWSTLCAYCLVTGFQAPLVRALVARALHAISDRLYFFWDLGKIQWLAGAITLLLIPEWIFNFSFYLSWMASLGFLLSPLVWKNRQSRFFLTFLSCFVIQTLMAACLGGFSLLGIFTNALLAPMIGFLLLPLSLSSLLFPGLISISDFLWAGLLFLLKSLADRTQVLQAPFDLPELSPWRWVFLWFFLALIQALFEALRLFRYQRSHV